MKRDENRRLGGLERGEFSWGATEDSGPERVQIYSFGFKYGLPSELHWVFDARFLPNPYWVEDLRELTGLNDEVSAFVLAGPEGPEFVQGMVNLLLPALRLRAKKGFSLSRVGIGCTGGKHRSVAVAEAVGAALRAKNIAVGVKHVDLGRE